MDYTLLFCPKKAKIKLKVVADTAQAFNGPTQQGERFASSRIW